MTSQIDSREPVLDRRRVLSGIAATGIASVAGCLGGDGEEADIDEALERNEIDIDEIVEGGTLEFAIPRNGISDYDQAQSTQAEDTVVLNAVYDGLLKINADAEAQPWLAAEYEASEANDVSVVDYQDYMIEIEPAEVEDGVPVFELEDDTNLVLMQHPDDLPAESGESIRVLTRNEAAAAVADGVFGVRVEGRLHEGIEFHNGEELTAENVVRSYDRYVGSNNQGQYYDSFLHAEAPDGADGYQFELYAQEADAAAFLELPPVVFPSEHFDVPPGELDPRINEDRVPIGTGPYEVAEFEGGQELRLERTDNYWVESVGLENIPWYDGPSDFPAGPVIDEINIRFVEQGSGRSNALEDGSIDVAYELPSEARNNFQTSDEYVVSATEALGFQFMQFPMDDTDPGGAFSERAVRQAVSALIPRQQIVDIVAQGWGDPAQVPFPEPAADLGTSQPYNEIVDSDWAYNVEPNVDAAQSLLDDADVETPVDVVLETNADDEARIDKVQLIVDQLDETDLFNAELETPAPLGDWTVDLYQEDARTDSSERNAPAIIGLAGTPDPHGFVEAITDPDNYNGCCNFFFAEGVLPEDFVDQMRGCRYGVEVAEDQDARRQAYDEFWPEYADMMANTIIDYSLNTGTTNTDVVGFNAHPQTQMLLSYALYNPADEQLIYLDR
ncbi:ABC transporter substrate-binding protein [Halostagnicola kamekurae]|uniref:ABC-type transport system, substrate-binding protein n=1 Tax=Halostagnicola kamekurae TaxID=619731 RepID=A0A1I6RZG6_9EURY|nr:ABC transporter substrate-binding protein [Halostagnicola kamekurae]SFS70087.1 ABC-type transport system, substrate-binding protein [Halostagnicola kamekurae]